MAREVFEIFQFDLTPLRTHLKRRCFELVCIHFNHNDLMIMVHQMTDRLTTYNHNDVTCAVRQWIGGMEIDLNKEELHKQAALFGAQEEQKHRDSNSSFFRPDRRDMLKVKLLAFWQGNTHMHTIIREGEWDGICKLECTIQCAVVDRPNARPNFFTRQRTTKRSLRSGLFCCEISRQRREKNSRHTRRFFQTHRSS